MKFLVEIQSCTTSFYNMYRIYEVDERVYYASPLYKSKPFWQISNPEFYFSKVNGIWSGEKDDAEDKEVPSYLLEEISTELELYLNKDERKKMRKVKGKWVFGK